MLLALPVKWLERTGSVQAQVADEVERERREWRRAQARRQEEKQAKHESTARAVVRDAIGLALMHALHREQCGLDAPRKVAREWIAMFHAEDVRLRSADEQVRQHHSQALVHGHMHLFVWCALPSVWTSCVAELGCWLSAGAHRCKHGSPCYRLPSGVHRLTS